MSERLTEILGWLGVTAIVAAYAMASLQVIEVTNIWYPILNILGAAGIVIDAWSDKNYQPVVLNVIWIAVAVIAIGNILRV